MRYNGTYTYIVIAENGKTWTCVVKLNGGYTIACASPIRPNKNSKMFFFLLYQSEKPLNPLLDHNIGVPEMVKTESLTN